MRDNAAEVLKTISETKDIREQLRAAVQFAQNYPEEIMLNYILVKEQLSDIYRICHGKEEYAELEEELNRYIECWEGTQDIKAVFSDVLVTGNRQLIENNDNVEPVISLAGQDLADYVVERYSNGELGMKPLIVSFRAWASYKLRGKKK